MANNRPLLPFGTPAWHDQLDHREEDFVKNSRLYLNRWFHISWPDMDSPEPDDQAADRFGYACGPYWSSTIWPFIFDGDWWGEGSYDKRANDTWEDFQQTLRGYRQSYVRKWDPPARCPSDTDRILSFWVSGGPDDDEPRTIDPTGLSDDNTIQLKLLIAVKMYSKREPWSDEYKGFNVTRDELGLPKPVKVVAGTSPGEIEKIERLLDRLPDGLPEVKVHGQRTWTLPPPSKEEDIKLWAKELRPPKHNSP